jgi:cell wall-associated NlpC family hydrolase
MKNEILRLGVLVSLFFVFTSSFADEVESASASAESGITTQATADSDSSSSKWSSVVQEVMLSAISLSGIKYKYGGTSPETGFDCSGFVRYVFQQAANLTLPHGARALSQLGQTVTQDNLQPGDLVFFNTLKTSFSHVGIYLGNNRFIHSPSPGSHVSIMSMNDSYWAKRFNGARRITSAQAKALTVTEFTQPTPAE